MENTRPPFFSTMGGAWLSEVCTPFTVINKQTYYSPAECGVLIFSGWLWYGVNTCTRERAEVDRPSRSTEPGRAGAGAGTGVGAGAAGVGVGVGAGAEGAAARGGGLTSSNCVSSSRPK